MFSKVCEAHQSSLGQCDGPQIIVASDHYGQSQPLYVETRGALKEVDDD